MQDYEQLSEALRARGFSIAHAVYVAHDGHLGTRLVQALRKLVGWRSEHPRELIERGKPILENVDRRHAERSAAHLNRYEALTATVEIGDACLYAWNPEHPRRGDQTVERIRVAGLGFAIERSQLGSFAHGQTTRFASVDALLAAIDEQRNAWADAGLRESNSELEILVQLSARDPTLEARLRASEGDERRREATVYGDWLQARGDPRGLVAAATAIEGVHVAGEAERARTQLLADHASHLFGPARRFVDHSRSRWCGPVLDTLVLRAVPSATALAEALALPISIALRRLEIHGLADCPKTLPGAACAPCLRELKIVASSSFMLELDRLERLERLELSGARLHLARARLPALRELAVELDLMRGELERQLELLTLPALEHLRIHVDSSDPWEPDTPPLAVYLADALQLPAFARLRRLSISIREAPSDSVFAGFAALLDRIPASATLEHVDLRDAALSDECIASLDQLRRRTSFRIHH